MPTYEAIYEDGQLEWIGDEPGPGRHRIEVRVVDRSPASPDSDETDRILDEAYGAWDTGKTLDEIDDEIDEMRSEWDRPGYDPDHS